MALACDSIQDDRVKYKLRGIKGKEEEGEGKAENLEECVKCKRDCRSVRKMEKADCREELMMQNVRI